MVTRSQGDPDRRPRGAVLGPLALLAMLAATGIGMWRALSHEAAPRDDVRLSWHRRGANEPR